MDSSVRRGDIFYADLSPVVGSEQGGCRPVLIVQNNMGNKHSPTVIAAAITSQMNKARLPTHIELVGPTVGLTQKFRGAAGAGANHRQEAPAGAHGPSGRHHDGQGGRRHCGELWTPQRTEIHRNSYGTLAYACAGVFLCRCPFMTAGKNRGHWRPASRDSIQNSSEACRPSGYAGYMACFPAAKFPWVFRCRMGSGCISAPPCPQAGYPRGS